MSRSSTPPPKNKGGDCDFHGKIVGIRTGFRKRSPFRTDSLRDSPENSKKKKLFRKIEDKRLEKTKKDREADYYD
ncbi:hypothetical protein [Leptospira stimsonii]|uniref:hypothetical protein n=1 Tax=Leptospira stimsonii TaxID=2202203 RepID=UPI0011C3E601|nr:hypothetical protein [Leptospira stimsonii]